MGLEARLDFFKMYQDDRAHRAQEGTTKAAHSRGNAPDSARHSFLESCWQGGSIPVPLLIGREDIAELKLSNFAIDDRLCEHLAVAMPKLVAQGVVLRSLDLGHNPLGEKGVVAIAAVLDRCAVLAALDFSGCDLSGSVAPPALGLALRDHGTICSLSLQKVRLQDRPAAELLSALEVHPTLRDLSLASNQLGGVSEREDGSSRSWPFASAVVQLITNSELTQFRSLDLGWNSLRGAAAEKVAQPRSLGSCKVLACLTGIRYLAWRPLLRCAVLCRWPWLWLEVGRNSSACACRGTTLDAAPPAAWLTL